MPKKVKYYIVFIVCLVFLVGLAKSASTDNVSGWAWSETIGWISFNCTDTSCANSNYGVNIDSSTGNFSGYAWSENIGWVDFNPSSGFPAAPNYSACIDIPGVSGEACDGIGDWKVAGWAKVIAADGSGWDGWIKLGDGTSWPDGGSQVWLDTSVSPYELRGWAWGSDVVGWISFNCVDQGVCGSSNYKVIADINFPPSAGCNDSETWSYCTDSKAPTLSWTYSDPEGDPQESFWIQVDDGDFSIPEQIEINTGERFSSGTTYHPSATEASNLNWDTTYYWRVKVKDDQGNWSQWSSPNCSFTTPLHAYPNVDFNWSPEEPSALEPVQFSDQSTCYDDIISGGDCTSVNDTFKWTIEGTTEGNPVVKWGEQVIATFSEPGLWNVSLEVTDSDGFNCSIDKDVNVNYPLPEWREIKPR